MNSPCYVSTIRNRPMLTPDSTSAAPPIPKVDLSQPAAQGTYEIAKLLMKVVYWFLSLFGWEHNETLFTACYAVIVFIISIIVGYVVKWIVLFIVRKLGHRLHDDVYQFLTEEHFFAKTSRIFPAIVFLIFIQFTLNGRMTLSSWLTRLTWIYLSFVLSDTLCIIADVMWKKINARANKRKLPLNGIVQLLKGMIWLIWIIVALAIVFDKSPGSLLAGLGAFAAVLMLIFKDSILGVVAGVQLSENDSLHVGDWIKGGGTEANGIVTEVSLTAVKVLNWDKTTTSIPPYNLVSIGFTNYMSMQNSNTRRIQRAYMIDADSVVPCDDKLLEEFSKIPMMANWIAKKKELKAAGNDHPAQIEDLANGTLDTNLGVFRAYVKMWLDSNPDIAHSDPSDVCFVTTLPQTPYGIPFQIYCFTSTSNWPNYEAIMSSVFEHISIMLHKFHLYTYESPSGRDTLIDGYLCPGKNPADLFGIPYPFFNNSGTPFNPGIPPHGIKNFGEDNPRYDNGDSGDITVDGDVASAGHAGAAPAHPAAPATPAHPV